MRAVGIASSERFAGLPSVPTIAESGVPGYLASSWNGVSVPFKTPRPIVEKLSKAIRDAVASPDVKQKLQDVGVTARGATPDETRKLIASDVEKWRRVIEAAHIPKQ